MIRRIFDVIISLIILIIFLPLMILICVLIKIESKGPVIFKQKRVGKGMKEFTIYKFRTMHKDSEKYGKLTISTNDKRITRVGRFLRKYKLDELPQFYNVLKGNMSIVGPRPEVPDYVRYYTQEQKEIFKYKPGITDVTSLMFYNESEILASVENPDKYYVEKLIPLKIHSSLEYLRNRTIFSDFLVILKTFFRIISKKK